MRARNPLVMSDYGQTEQRFLYQLFSPLITMHLRGIWKVENLKKKCTYEYSSSSDMVKVSETERFNRR